MTGVILVRAHSSWAGHRCPLQPLFHAPQQETQLVSQQSISDVLQKNVHFKLFTPIQHNSPASLDLNSCLCLDASSQC